MTADVVVEATRFIRTGANRLEVRVGVHRVAGERVGQHGGLDAQEPDEPADEAESALPLLRLEVAHHVDADEGAGDAAAKMRRVADAGVAAVGVAAVDGEAEIHEADAN